MKKLLSINFFIFYFLFLFLFFLIISYCFKTLSLILSAFFIFFNLFLFSLVPFVLCMLFNAGIFIKSKLMVFCVILAFLFLCFISFYTLNVGKYVKYASVDLDYMLDNLDSDYFLFEGVSYNIKQGRLSGDYNVNIPHFFDSRGDYKIGTCVLFYDDCLIVSRRDLVGKKNYVEYFDLGDSYLIFKVITYKGEEVLYVDSYRKLIRLGRVNVAIYSFLLIFYVCYFLCILKSIRGSNND